MATYVPAKRATEYICYVCLTSQADNKLFQVNPTLAAGDVKVSLDGGAFNNLTTLPVVTPAGGRAVKVTLSIAEMTADNVEVVFSDAAGAEWCDLSLNIQTTATQIDNLVRSTTPANALTIDAAGLIGISNTIGVKKNTALANFGFYMLDSTTHVTPKTGLSVTSERSLDGAAFAACTNAAAELSDGVYVIDLAAADLNADVVVLKFTAVGGDPTLLTIRTSV
jgi:hypothetical protein